MSEITNGQKVRASFDLFDAKGKVIVAGWPAGSVITVTGGDAGGDTGVAQWLPDADPDNGKGTITTEGDNVGHVDFAFAGTTPDGAVFNDVIAIDVINGPPSSAKATLGTPIDE